MGTRADFYVGKGKDAEWLGSIAYDGYPDGIPDDVKGSMTEQQYRDAVAAMIAGREDGTTPEQGWPWPWDDSNTTNYAYSFDKGEVSYCGYGKKWFSVWEEEPDEYESEEEGEFPNMADRKNV